MSTIALLPALTLLKASGRVRGEFSGIPSEPNPYTLLVTQLSTRDEYTALFFLLLKLLHN